MDKVSFMKKIGFVILTWNSQNVIEACVDSIKSLDSDEIEATVVIVDNCSSDNTKKIISKKIEAYKDGTEISLIALDKNYGTTVSRNKGINFLLSKDNVPDYLCILDSDTQITTKAMIKLVDRLDSNSKTGIIGPRMHDSKNVYQRSGRQIPTLTEKLLKVIPIKKLQAKGTAQESSISEEGTGCVKVGYLMSACWMMRMNLVGEVGVLDEKIFYAPEDVDYCIAVQKAGYDIEYCYDADILHEWQRLSRKKLISKHNYEHVKGLIYMFKKYGYVFNSNRIFDKRSKV